MLRSKNTFLVISYMSFVCKSLNSFNNNNFSLIKYIRVTHEVKRAFHNNVI